MAIDYAAAQTWDKDGGEQALMTETSVSSPSLAGCSRGFAAQKIYSILWKMRFAHFPQDTVNQASAAGASKRS